VHKSMRVVSRHSLGHQEWDDLMRVASGDAVSQKEMIVMFHIA
jgi:hypothetical protein